MGERVAAYIACTVCSASHLPQALAMFESLEASEPGIVKYVYLADVYELDKEIEDIFQNRGINIVTFSKFAEDFILDNYIRLNPLEFYTSLKPTIIKHCLSNNKNSMLLYCDVDLIFFDSILNEINQSEFSVYLTPHNINPSDHASEFHLTRNGVFNAGLLLVNGQEGLGFLNWWEEKCRYFCLQEPEEGVFVDQKWLDLVPALFENVKINRNIFINVGYWNIQEIPPTKLGEIKVLHISGCETESFGKPHLLLSKFSSLICPSEIVKDIKQYIQNQGNHEYIIERLKPYVSMPELKLSDIRRRHTVFQKQLILNGSKYEFVKRQSKVTNIENMNRSKNMVGAVGGVVAKFLLLIRFDWLITTLLNLSRVLSRKTTWVFRK